MIIPLPLFDTIEQLDTEKNFSYLSEAYSLEDINISRTFLKAYRSSQGTFNSYRREIERLLHWCALIAHKNLTTLTREDMEAFMLFCQHPPKKWIGITK